MRKIKNKKVLIMFVGWACALVLIFSLTCASLAKYVSEKTAESNAGVASFPCSISVDASGSTPLFLNSEYATYIYGDGDSETVLNPPQTVDFSVSNYIGNYVAEVAVNYSLVFYIPVVFSKVATVQITKDDDTSPVTPLYVLDKFLDAAKEKVKADSTDSNASTDSKIYVNTTPVTRTTVTDSDGKEIELSDGSDNPKYDYDNVSTKLQDSYIDNGMIFTQKTENKEDGTTTIVETESTYGAVGNVRQDGEVEYVQQVFECTKVTTDTGNGEVTSASFKATDDTGTVTVEKITMSSTVVRGYSTYQNSEAVTETTTPTEDTTTTEDTNATPTAYSDTNETETTSTKLRLANIYLTTTENVAYYKFTIYHNNFNTLPAGTKTARSYGLRMSLTKGISDTDNPIDGDYSDDVSWTKFLETSGSGEDLKYNVTTTAGWEVSVEKYEVTDENGTTQYDYNVTLTYSTTAGTKITTTSYSNVKVDSLDEKNYPCRLNALFEQVLGS